FFYFLHFSSSFLLFFFFFFSSRRRHTRSVSAFLLNRSSDLKCLGIFLARLTLIPIKSLSICFRVIRSEERRVGKECRFVGSPGDAKRNVGTSVHGLPRIEF